LEVFDQSQFEHLAIGDIANDNGDFVHAEALGSAESAFAGDDLVAVAMPSDDDGLKDAVFKDRGLEVIEVLRGEVLARLVGIRVEACDG
jgi:hypothetical protein